MWDTHSVCESAAEALCEEAAKRDEEQSPYGLDALDEVDLHPLLATGFERRGWGVLREQRYPNGAGRPRRSEGDRCDFVITHEPGAHLLDPLLSGTLFADRGVDPAEALWVEVKAAHQHALIGGVAGPDRGYASSLLTAAVSDIRKLGADAGIAHACLLLVMFTQDERVARHDLGVWAHRCLDKGLPIRAPATCAFTLSDRIGNGACLVAAVTVDRAG
ncbi:MAG: hypothetical protein EA379_09155 [Phycisphaerales bacterium]|nr:MAG: hypothetical protein EA379_09155 [Phycisphaerales bacterium]